MKVSARLIVTSASTEHTVQFAKRFAGALRLPFKLYLGGELGSGKTTFARGLLESFAAVTEVCSPSFALVETYHAGGAAIAHIDLFRCRDKHEWLDAGLAETLQRANLCVIEWPQNAAELPEPDVQLTIDDGAAATERKLTFCAYTRKGQKCLAQL